MERMILILTILCVATTSKSQQFQVRSFKQLTNDISAYIDTVRDLNDEACALVKVVCSQDFVFSSPLGIVKRKNETGEIWLYLPQGSTLLTLKHPQWGVLRDYQFLKPLESRMTYELVVDEPTETKMIPLTILTPPTITLVRKDTLIVFSPKQRHPSKPFNYFLTATLSVTNDHPMAGFRMAVYKQHGIYLSIASDLHSSPTISGETDNSIIRSSPMREGDGAIILSLGNRWMADGLKIQIKATKAGVQKLVWAIFSRNGFFQ